MTLEIDVRLRRGSFTLEARFETQGRLIAFFGPSGSGKTSLVNLVAGLERPESGRIVADGHVLVDTRTGRYLPVHKRRIGYVFQDARLFPHLSVSQNLLYGRFFAPVRERYAGFDSVVAMLGLEKLLARRPDLLSGGEKQRVGIARALLASPRLILMDEPLAALDEARKAEILPYIERLRDETKIPIIYVSHSLAEVARLASDMVVLADGRVRAVGSTGAIMQRLDLLPAQERGEAGALLELHVESHEPSYGLTLLRSGETIWRLPAIAAPKGARVTVRVRARDVMIATRRPEGLSAMNVVAGTIREIAHEGAEARISLDCEGTVLLARITRFSAEALGLQQGQPVYAVVKAVTFDQANTNLTGTP
ncbi:molybdenum ABC transporter ATP-binding protein [Mesorhizobium sp. NBSH29]|uniref:molybdenum ABC transporter ATP-binding protein n=1 Tax=Mesorhizobium sp. NBSH29 TaxID=2654249 RepID=UPI00189687AE|nr:molybdenum ABC transporter ATP-binding protein [Mesorhizobium sp. NBSH29]QPC86682.1 molybdenum ABC transporter ATP-binding protein [Mesorhizobium sp. NBSH29]